MRHAAGRLVCIAAAVTVTMTGFGGDDNPNVLTPSAETRDAFRLFADFLDTLQKHYIDPGKIQTNQHIREALRTFVRSLDPEADYLNPEQAAEVKTAPDKNVGEIGLVIAIRDGVPTVVTPLDGSSSQRAGLLGGKQLIAVNGQSTAHATLAGIATKLRGPVGSRAVLTLHDPVTQTQRVLIIERAAPSPPPVPKLKFLVNGIAYLRLSNFSTDSIEQLISQVRRAESEHARALIIDLRNNPGGQFDSLTRAGRLFVPANHEIVTLAFADEKHRLRIAGDDSRKFGAPIVLLVNGSTAAEAEIFAAALRDNQRARLVGAQTFGRGRQISLFALPDGSAALLPTAVFLPPSGTPFEGIGLTPDVLVALPSDVERSLATAGFGTFDWVNDKPQVLATDLQLARALELLSK